MNNLRTKRQSLGLSQTKLAIMVGVSNSVLSEIELDKRAPWPRLRKALAQALGCRESDVFPEGQNHD